MVAKRKRAPTASQHESHLDRVQPSSRDASEEDAQDPILQEIRSAKHENNESSPSKRSRSKGDCDVSSNRNKLTNGEREQVMEALKHGEGGERGTMRMPDPPKAGLVDPKGYHTNPPPQGRPVRIYADGVFDLFHLGHMRQLQQAKQAFPEVYLIVGVTGDKETHRRKGLTVLSGKERAESVRHCKWVDEVVEDCPWIIADHPEFMEKYKIDYVAHDDIPYGAGEDDDIYAPIKKQGKFLVTQRTEGVSTTGIITKVVKDYDKYIARQLKRGTTRQELNVSWLKKNELDIKRNMAELRDSVKNNWATTGQELTREFRQFWEKSTSRSASPAPHSRERSDGDRGKQGTMTSPTVLSHLTHLDMPKSNANGTNTASSDFAAGYSLGLIGGVRSWMMGRRRTLNDSQADDSPLDSDGETSPTRSPTETPSRGRQGNPNQDEIDAQVVNKMA